jgi:hypothetical protein
MTRLHDQSQGSTYNIYKQSISQAVSWRDMFTVMIQQLSPTANHSSGMICDTSR